MTADGLGRTTQMPFDISTSTRPNIIYPDGSQVSTTYNQFRQPLMTIDELGRITRMVYDTHGNLQSRTVASGTNDQATWTWTWTYNGRGQPVAMTDPNMHLTMYQYTTEGYLAAIIEPPDIQGASQAQWRFAYDTIGNRISLTDPVGRLVTTAYDSRNRPVSLTYADASTETMTYGSGTEANLMIARTDRNGNLTQYSFDGDGREITQVVAAGSTVQDSIQSTYLPGTALIASRVNLGDTTTTEYDYQNRPDVTTNFPNLMTALSTTVDIDAAGQSVRTTDPYGRLIERAYDLRGRMVREAAEMVPGALSSEQDIIDAIPDPSTSAWTFQDVGNPSTPGSISINGGIVTINGIGIEMWSDAEQFSLYDQTLVGDGSITARVVSQQNTDPWAKAGVMIRTADEAESGYAALFVSPGYGVSVNDRAATGLDTTYEPVSPLSANIQWLRLERIGTDVRSYTSIDGKTWTLGNETTVGLGAQVRIGLFVLAHESGTPCTAVFDNVQVTLAPEQGIDSVLALTQQYVLGLDRSTATDVILTDFSYDHAGELVTAIDGRGIATMQVFDFQGRIISHTAAAGTVTSATTTTTFDPVSNVLSVADPLGRLSTRIYSERNLLLSRTDAAGLPEAVTITHTYTPTKNIQTTTTPLGTTTFFYGNCCDRLVQITDESGFQTSFTYDSFGNRTSMTDGNGITSQTAYDARNRVSTTTNGAGEVTRYTYDDHLNDGQGLDATFSNYLKDLPLGPGADGSAVLITDPLGDATLHVYDGIHRPLRFLDPMLHAATTSYDVLIAGLVDTSIKDAVGNVTQQLADAHRRQRRTIDAEGHTTFMDYDQDNNRVTLRDPNGVGADWQFDALNRPVIQIDTMGAVTTFSYDLAGNRLSEQDALGHTTSDTYDGLNRRISITDRIGATTLMSYDPLGNLLAITDAQGGRTTYAYDPRSLRIQESFPGIAGGIRSYSYDGGRRVISRTDQAGVVTRYTYDLANRLVSRNYPDLANDTYAYDHAGRLLQARSQRYANTVNRAYDAASRMTNEAITVIADPLQQTTLRYDVFYGYDNADRLTLLSYPDGTQAHRQYTPRNELASVTYAGGPVVTRTYDAGGRLVTSVAGNGLQESRSYRLDDLVQSIAVPGVTGFAYTYDSDKRMLTESNQILPTETQRFDYDAEDRVTAWQESSIPARTQSWNLSLVGDWTQTTLNGSAQQRTHNSVHEITAIDQKKLAYDAKGNIIQDPIEDLRLGWDPENLLEHAEHHGEHAHYSYDALGRRVRKTVGELTTTFVCARGQEIWETDTDQAVYQQEASNGGVPTSDRPLGGVMTGINIFRIDFQPATATTPVGFQPDTGQVLSLQANGRTYGWVGGPQPYTNEYDVMPLPPFNGNNTLQSPGHSNGIWQIDLPNGSYPVIVVMGDAEHRDMINDVNIGGKIFNDPNPDSPNEPQGYEQGRFVGYAVQVQVINGRFQIEPRSSAVKARICFLEVGVAGTALNQEIRSRLNKIVQTMTEATAGTPPKLATRAYVYGNYVDQPLIVAAASHGHTQTRYFYGNRVYSVAALTDNVGKVVERYRYSAYGQQTVEDGNGIRRAASLFKDPIGFTGRLLDTETGLWYFRARYLDSTLGRFAERDKLNYINGFNLYSSYFIPNSMDPSGSDKCTDCIRNAIREMTDQGMSIEEMAKLIDTYCTVECKHDCPTAGTAPIPPGETDCTDTDCKFDTAGEFYTKDLPMNNTAAGQKVAGAAAGAINSAVNQYAQTKAMNCDEAEKNCLADCSTRCSLDTQQKCFKCCNKKKLDCLLKKKEADNHDALEFQGTVQQAQSDNNYNGSAGSGQQTRPNYPSPKP